MSQVDVRRDNDMGGRLPLLEPKGLATAQRGLYDHLQSTKIIWAKESGFEGALPDGRLIGPFNVFLYSPELGRGFNDWVDAESANTTLSGRVRQIVVLTVGATWGAAYELYAHAAVGRAAGLEDELVAALCDNEKPSGVSDEEMTAYRFTRALAVDHAVSDTLYQLAVETFGERGLVDVVNLIGIYLSTSALLNAFRIPVPK